MPVQSDFVARDRKWQGPDPDATVFWEDLAEPAGHDGQIVGGRYDFTDAEKAWKTHTDVATDLLDPEGSFQGIVTDAVSRDGDVPLLLELVQHKRALDARMTFAHGTLELAREEPLLWCSEAGVTARYD